MPTIQSKPATAPQLLDPQPDSVVDGRAVTFEWSDVPGATGYRFQIAFDEAFSDLHLDADVGDTTAFTLYDVLPVEGAQMRWRVAAGLRGSDVFSGHRAFEVAVERAPSPVVAVPEEVAIPRDTSIPLLLTPQPGDVTDGLATTFEWESAEAADAYRFQIAEDISFSDVLMDADVGDTNLLTVYDSLPLDGPELVWRVGAMSGTGARWSEPAVFLSVSDLAERVRHTVRNVVQAATDVGSFDMDTTIAIPTSAIKQTGSMGLVWTWVLVTTAAALLIILKVMLT